MNLEDFMLGEMSQLQKDKYCIVPLVWTETETESGMVAVGLGRGTGSYSLVGTVSVWEDGKVLEMGGGDNCTTMWISLMSLKYTLKNG